MKKIMAEFKTFISRGSVIDLAVGIIIGGAFTKIVNALVNDIVMPLLGMLTGRVNISELKYIIAPAAGDAAELSVKYGSFLQTCIDFFVIAFSIFVMIKMINAFNMKKVIEKVTSTIDHSANEPLPAKPRIWRRKSGKRRLRLRKGAFKKC